MQLRHGSLVLSLPDDWHDLSQLLFVSPTPEVPLHSGKTGGAEAVSIRLQRSSEPPDEALRTQAEALEQMDVDYRCLERGSLTAGLGTGPFYVQRFELEGAPVMQLVTAFALGPFVVHATASAPEASFKAARARLEQILASMDVV